MTETFRVTDVVFTAADQRGNEAGLVGFASCLLNGGLRVDGVAVRRTLGGRIIITFPARLDSRGRKHAILAPINESIRRDLERQILEALGFAQEDDR